MADESLDRLSIEVKASVDSASRSISELNKKLSALSSSLSLVNGRGLSGFSSEMKKINSAISRVKDSKVENIEKLGRAMGVFGRKNVQIATSNIPTLTSGIESLVKSLNGVGKINFDNSQFAEIVNSMGKLGGVNIQRAITVIPQFTNELMKMLNELSRAPEIASSTVQMTNALGNLANSLRGNGGIYQGGGNNNFLYAFKMLDSGLHKTVRRLKSFGHEIVSTYKKMANLQKKTIDLAAAFGKFYATYWLFLRIAKGMWGFTGKAMEYVETLNYFDETMKQIISRSDLSAWEELGYESAKAYADSFYENAFELFTKTTGYKVADNGRLVNAMTKSLGLDPQAVMGAYTQFAQMSSSMGIASNTAMKMAQALTLIGTDLSSIRDVAFDDTWNALSSGLTGTARALDKYGVNLRISGLNQELIKLGIDATANSLSQADRAILRTITILDSGEFAWADLIETIDTGANRLRVLQASTSNLSRTLGQIFLPIVAKVLPYVTALVNALQRLAEWFVTLLGFEDFDWGGFGDIGDGFSDILDSADDATGAVKKLKSALMGIDELNVLNDNDNGGSGSGGLNASGLLDAALDEILSRYMESWNAAYDGLEDRTQKFADNVQRIFKESGLKGVGQYFADSIADGLESINWDKIWKTSGIVGSGTANFLNGFIDERLFYDIGNTIASYIKTGIVGALNFSKTFDWSNLGISIANGINGFTRNYPWREKLELAKTLGLGLSDTINDAVANIDVESAGNYLYSKIGSIIDFSYNLIANIDWKEAHKKAKEIMKKFMENMGTIDKSTGKNGWQKLGATLGDGISEALDFAFDDIPWGDVLFGAFTSFKEALDKIWEEHPMTLTLIVSSFAFKQALGFAIQWATLSKLFGTGASVVAGAGASAGGISLFIPAMVTLSVVGTVFSVKEVIPKIVDEIDKAVSETTEKGFFQATADRFERATKSIGGFFHDTFVQPENDYQAFCDNLQSTTDAMMAGINVSIERFNNTAMMQWKILIL